MWILQSTVLFAMALLLSQLPDTHGQNNQCTAAAIAICGPYSCLQTGDIYSCLCSDMTLQPSAAACNGGVVTTTLSPIVIPNQCANANCPAGATCIPTNQNPALYVCVCPNNIIANPGCPINPLPINPCLTNNPCLNGGTCVVNQLTLQAVCICPTGSYGTNCAYGCNRACDGNWCYNGARCANAYGEPYCFCGENYRGRRCELRHSRTSYGYLYHNPRSHG